MTKPNKPPRERFRVIFYNGVIAALESDDRGGCGRARIKRCPRNWPFHHSPYGGFRIRYNVCLKNVSTTGFLFLNEIQYVFRFLHLRKRFAIKVFNGRHSRNIKNGSCALKRNVRTTIPSYENPNPTIV